MKKYFFTIMLALLTSATALAQTATMVVTARNYIHADRPQYIPFFLGSTLNFYKTSVDSLFIRPVQVIGLKDVAISASYLDLVDKPTIPINTNQLVNGAGFISSFTELDPTVPSYSKSLTAFSVIKASTDPLYRPISYVPTWAEVTGKPIFATVANTGAYGDLSGKPTIPSAQVQTDWNATSGMGQVLNKPVIGRVEAYTGTTNSSGEYSFTFATPFTSTPKVVASPVTSDNRANVIVVSRSTTGFTVRMLTYNVVNVLGIEVVAGAPVPVNSGTVQVIVTE